MTLIKSSTSSLGGTTEENEEEDVSEQKTGYRMAATMPIDNPLLFKKPERCVMY